jgi:hypothetical protein
MGASTIIREGGDKTEKPVERGGKTSPGLATENQVGGREMQALRNSSTATKPDGLHEFHIAGMSSSEHSTRPQGQQNERSSAGQPEHAETSKVKSVERKEGAKPGDYTLNSTTMDGRKTTDTHVGNADGGSTDTRESGGRTTVNTYDKNNNRVYGKDTQKDGSSHEFKLNKDGSTTDRFQQRNGDYSEYTAKSGKTTSLKHEGKPDGGFVDTKSGAADGSSVVHDQDAKGNYKETTTTKDGKKSTFDHTLGKDGAFTEKRTDSDGKVATTEHTPTQDGGFKETTIKPDGSTVEKRQDANGSFTELSEDKDGNVQSLKTRAMKADGGLIDRTTTPDGSLVHVQKPNGEYTETSKDSTGTVNSPPLEVRGAPSDDFVQKTKNEISQLPAADRKLLADNGYKYVVGETVKQAQPELKGTPTGTGPKGSWDKDVVGVNYGKEITVGEKVNGQDVNDKTNQIVNHETGHAVDAILGAKQDPQYQQKPENQPRLTNTKAFADAYGEDFNQLSSKERRPKGTFAYETQMGHYPTHPDSAKREAFAQVYAAVRDTSGTNPQSKQTMDRFPNTTAYVKQQLEEMNK